MLHSAMTLTALVGLSSMMVLSAVPPAGAAEGDKPVVELETTLGKITVELESAKAPISAENFLKYVDKGFYDGVVFHRVIPGFMIQTGGMNEVGNTLKEKRKDAFPPIKNESGRGLSNLRGTLAMARTPAPDSATSQFFINLDDKSRSLDTNGGGYAVFGRVIAGMEVVDAIAKVETGTKRADDGTPHDDVPVTPVVLKSAKRKSKP